ncbi:hypothetical protein LXM25_16930 [Dyadobacter sp. LJ53]|uniref:DUF6934 family protein n=1 Tax=Dyadobacter chenwenxiniae TaxID=2906456 RepID=UPI001F42E137|nr:hypothetical protein [Dyadobacter chenwenxiniae]MCF0051753.1 hypothetical protein [Dyadobacter chenwenxiniae]
MDKPFYQLTVLNEAFRFDFMSVGRNQIPKTITFYKTDDPRLFTLTLATVRPDGSLDTKTVSNNGDMEKILVTVYKAIDIFLSNRSSVIVGFSGNTDARTRLYQIAIAKHFFYLSEHFNIWGLTNNDIESFCINRKYLGFFISLKNVNID